MIGTTLLNYRILKKLGQGGGGEVYLAEDTRLQRTVVLKILPRELVAEENARKRFMREARLASALDHPNICTIYEINEADGLHFIVMQYAEGKTLRQVVANKPLDTESALSIAIQIADALTTAHERGIIHRDIKPANVIITKKGQVKILDFGLAKSFPLPTISGSEAVEATELTRQGAQLGTPAYMSPEQARAQPADHRSDIFSFGVILYEMVTGRSPFKGKNRSSVEVMHSVIHDQPQPISELNPRVPPQLQTIIERALEKEPSKRYQSMRTMLNDLKQVARSIHLDASSLSETAPAYSAPRHEKSSWFKENIVRRALGRLRRRPSEESLSRGSPRRSPSSPDVSVSGITKDKKTIAILPFRNMSGKTEDDFYGFSLADSLITELATLRSLVVRPSSYIAKYRGKEFDPTQVGRELAVDAVLIGGFVRAGNRFRVTPQLVDINSGEILWSDKIDVEYQDIITIQDQISRRIVEGLRIKNIDLEQERLIKGITASAEAYEYYLRGRNLLYQFIGQTLLKSDLDMAVEMFQRATELDPQFALAHSGLGVCYVNYVTKAIGGAEYYRKAEQAFKRAIQLNDKLVEPRLRMVYIYLLDGDKEKARRELKTLLREAPNDSSVRFVVATLYRLDGLYHKAIKEYESILKLNPADLVIVSYNRARIMTYQKKFNEAIAELEKGFAVEPEHPMIKTFYAQASYYMGNIEKAAALLKEILEKHPEMNGIVPFLSMCYSKQGRGREALELITDKVKEVAAADHDVAYWLASVYALEKQNALAIQWFKKAIALGNENYPWFNSDPNLDNIRDDPQFKEILEELRRRWEKLGAQPRREDQLQALMHILKEEKDEAARFDAVHKLLYSYTDNLLPALVEALKDESGRVKSAAIDILGRVDNERAFDPVIDLMRQAEQNRDFLTLRFAVKALGVIGNKRAIPFLSNMLNNENEYVSYEAALALAAIKDDDSLHSLVDSLQGESPSLRFAAAEALGQLGDSRAMPALQEALLDEDEGVRAKARWALNRLKKSAGQD